MDSRHSAPHSTVVSNDAAPSSTMPEFTDDAERRDWLIKTLGEPFCRKLGIFRIPET